MPKSLPGALCLARRPWSGAETRRLRLRVASDTIDRECEAANEDTKPKPKKSPSDFGLAAAQLCCAGRVLAAAMG